MRALIYGAGAMGTILGAFIAKSGFQIDLVTRNVAHVQALNEKGATVEGAVNFTQSVTAFTPDQIKNKYDLVFLMTKQSENASICLFLKEFLTENGAICTLQNGLPEAKIADIVGENRTFGAACVWGASYVSPGVSRLTSERDSLSFLLGSYSKNADPVALKTIEEYLSSMAPVIVTDNLLGARWSKLSVNAAFSGLSCISGLSFGEIAKDKLGNRLALSVFRECKAVAKSAGIVPEKIEGKNALKLLGGTNIFQRTFAKMILPFAMRKHKNLYSGMYFALKEGKKCDIDYICGIVCEFGIKFNVSTPTLCKIVQIAHSIENGEKTISPKNFNDF